jgi:hypothetical protein
MKFSETLQEESLICDSKIVHRNHPQKPLYEAQRSIERDLIRNERGKYPSKKVEPVFRPNFKPGSKFGLS